MRQADENRVRRVVILGGGTAGWMTAAALAKVFGRTLSITLLESDEIGTVGMAPTGTPSLYFEVRIDGRPADPVQWLKPASSKPPA